VATTTTHTIEWGFEDMEHVCNIENNSSLNYFKALK
jgi:hypothetical protein